MLLVFSGPTTEEFIVAALRDGGVSVNCVGLVERHVLVGAGAVSYRLVGWGLNHAVPCNYRFDTNVNANLPLWYKLARDLEARSAAGL